jgi:putative transposase
MVTAGTLHKRRWFQEPTDRDALVRELLETSRDAGWSLDAWAVFANHYHWVGRGAADALPLAQWIQSLHSQTARVLNERHACPGRRVWFNYWDAVLTYQRSYIARLAYVHRNAVHHGLVTTPEAYRWCSAGWPDSDRRPAWVKTLEQFPLDRLKVPDAFD